MYGSGAGTGSAIMVINHKPIPSALQKALSVFCAAARGATAPASAVWLAAAATRPALTGAATGSASCWPCSSPLSQEEPGNQKKNVSAATGRSRR